MDLVCYERDQGFVLARFREGEFDYLDAASEVVETEFFRYLGAEQILRALAATYPTPRQKEEVPLWVYLASHLSLRLHGVSSFHAYPYVVRCGGMLNAFGPTVASKVTHPDTGDVTLRCAGFNARNHYDRQTPCDQDFLRKLARDTEAAAWERWDNRDVVRRKILAKARRLRRELLSALPHPRPPVSGGPSPAPIPPSSSLGRGAVLAGAPGSPLSLSPGSSR